MYILLDLLETILEFHRPGEHIRRAYERARKAGALDQVPGLVYLAPEASWQEPVLVDTGLQRLVQHLDELPDEVHGLSLLEPPSRRSGLSARPLADNQVRSHCRVLSMIITQGCKFTCPYCPIPSLNQKTWRFRSPEGLVRQFKTVRERYGIKFFFGADDNFLNRRETAVEFLEPMSRAKLSSGERLGSKVRWGTEATQFDTHKNIDLLPLARQAGLVAIWFGIEDLTAELINKGQKPEKTIEVFKAMHENKICPMAMMMFHEGQPFHTPQSLYGLANQIDFLRKAGAISVQITIHIPAIGTREYEKTYETGRVLESLGDYQLGNAHQDGLHVQMSGATPMWQKEIEVVGGYFRFYNPLNLLRAFRDDGSPLRRYRIGYQLIGLYGTLWTFFALIPYFLRLVFSKPRFHRKTPAMTKVPIRQAKGVFPRFPRLPQPEKEHQQNAAA